MPVLKKLTQDFVDRDLRCPEGKKRIEYCCSELRGLMVEVRATTQGQGTYYLRYKSYKDGLTFSTPVLH